MGLPKSIKFQIVQENLKAKRLKILIRYFLCFMTIITNVFGLETKGGFSSTILTQKSSI